MHLLKATFTKQSWPVQFLLGRGKNCDHSNCEYSRQNEQVRYLDGSAEVRRGETNCFVYHAIFVLRWQIFGSSSSHLHWFSQSSKKEGCVQKNAVVKHWSEEACFNTHCVITELFALRSQFHNFPSTHCILVCVILWQFPFSRISRKLREKNCNASNCSRKCKMSPQWTS